MPNPLKFVAMMVHQRGPQVLARTEEPEAITDHVENVLQYDQVMTTKLVIAYALGLEAIYRARSAVPDRKSTVLDLACGPGHYSLCLKNYLGYDHVTGFDLSPRMIQTAEANARQRNMDRNTSFCVRDITNLGDVERNSFDLCSFTDAAHHIVGQHKTDMSARKQEALDTVAKIVAEMDRVTKPEGLVMLMDLARLRTAALTDTYVNLLGGDYVSRGLSNFFDDFRNSMYAAWTYSELETTIPRKSRRAWYHLVSKALPTMQIIFGLPVGRQSLFIRRGLPWKPKDCPVPKNLRLEWRLARLTLFSASATYISPLS